MRQSDPPVSYLVGAPLASLVKHEQDLLDQQWKNLRPGIDVKLLAADGETYVLARNAERHLKEKSMRVRRLRTFVKALKGLRDSKRDYKRDTILIKLGEAKKAAGPRVWALLEIASGKTSSNQPPVTFHLSRHQKSNRETKLCSGDLQPSINDLR